MKQGHKVEFRKTNAIHGEVYLDGVKLSRVVDFRLKQDGPFQHVVLVLDPGELHIFDKPNEDAEQTDDWSKPVGRVFKDIRKETSKPRKGKMPR